LPYFFIVLPTKMMDTKRDKGLSTLCQTDEDEEERGFEK
jgi:hypothetical protein